MSYSTQSAQGRGGSQFRGAIFKSIVLRFGKFFVVFSHPHQNLTSPIVTMDVGWEEIYYGFRQRDKR